MKSLCIKTNNSNILEYISNDLKNSDLCDIYFSINSFKSYDNIIIHYLGNDINSFLFYIKQTLSLCIIDEYETELLRNLIVRNYYYFNDFEINEIIEKCKIIFSEDFYTYFDKKIDYLINAFSEYFSTNNILILNGFINFKIPKYLNILEEVIEKSISNYVLEKEYLEFTSLLCSYINTQPDSDSIIHLVYTINEFILLDENLRIISTSNFSSKFISDFSFSNNDYILNTLLSIIPRKIYIHSNDISYFNNVNNLDFINNHKNINFLQIILTIFKDRVIICYDSDSCNICNIDLKKILKIDI